jgi:hypothetical protein
LTLTSGTRREVAKLAEPDPEITEEPEVEETGEEEDVELHGGKKGGGFGGGSTLPVEPPAVE